MHIEVYEQKNTIYDSERFCCRDHVIVKHWKFGLHKDDRIEQYQVNGVFDSGSEVLLTLMKNKVFRILSLPLESSIVLLMIYSSYF